MTVRAEDRPSSSAPSGRAPREGATAATKDPGSFRDPSGFVFRRDGQLYRQINRAYEPEWQALLASGLHGRLVKQGALVDYEEAPLDLALDDRAAAVIRPKPIDFISYPYEWTFGQLKEAALLTLQAHAAALDAGFALKDATAYNVQFHDGRAVLIDSLSFERSSADTPWVAYRQFCEHFLAPLALMAFTDIRCGLLLRDFVDGIPLDLAARLLPSRTRLRFGIAAHIHAHAGAQRRYKDRGEAPTRATSSALRQRALVDSLRNTVEKLSWAPEGTDWADYADDTSYSDAATVAKKQLVERFVRGAAPRRVWDLGANTGVYSRIAADAGARVVAFDVDAGAAERHYRALRQAGRRDTLPLVVDLTNPSPGLGWANRERRPLGDRGTPDLILALALIHHLAIGRNVPLDHVSRYFATLAPEVVIEFVPKGDPMVDRLLATRRDVFDDYSIDAFRAAFTADFDVVEEAPVAESTRTLFHLKRRVGAGTPIGG